MVVTTVRTPTELTSTSVIAWYPVGSMVYCTLGYPGVSVLGLGLGLGLGLRIYNLGSGSG